MTEDSSSAKNRVRPQEGPPRLTPPDAAGRKEQNASRAVPLLIVGCGLLLIIAALLILFLPLQQENPTVARQVEPQESLPITQQPAKSQVTSDDDFTREIGRLMELWLQKQAEAEAVNIAAWGGDRYAEAVSLGKECSQLQSERQYLLAKGACEGAIDHLSALMTSRESLLEAAIAAGLLALERGDSEVAAGHFQRALAIDTADKRAASGARRAEQLPAVLSFLQDGLTLEKVNDQEGALLAFTAAATLDPDFAPAREALARVRAGAAERAFQQAMSHALQAIADGKLSAASSALQKAEAIRPGDRAVRDLRQQLGRAQLAGKLTSLRQGAERLEQEERWAEALPICKEALTLDSHAAFAVSCAERASMRVDLDNRLKAIFAKPERLFEDGPLEAARQALAQASNITPRGAILTTQINHLEQLIAQAKTQVEVVIQSDGLTEVAIYHVGRLGLFQEKTLVLRTGDYTATGSRNGFRDVRQTLKVRPGSGKTVFTLRCEEPI